MRIDLHWYLKVGFQAQCFIREIILFWEF